MTNTEAAAELRRYLKAHGIKARVHNVAGTRNGVAVVVPTYEARFTADEITFIAHTARDMDMTLVRGLPIEPEHLAGLTGRQHWEFYTR